VWSEHEPWILCHPKGLVQVRIIQDDPEPRYDLSIGLRLIRNHLLDRPQGECEQRVAAVQQSRSYGRGMNELA
jgi:hypothetical protein